MKALQKYVADVGILRDYNGIASKLSHLSVCRQSGIEDGKNFTAKGEAGNDRKLDNSLSRTKSRIQELSLCNPWKWFVTLTLDPQKYDRTDLEKFRGDFAQFIRDYRKKTGNPVKYLLIPEHHKDGAWHMHGFFLGLPEEALHRFSLKEHLPHQILERIKGGTSVFTWPEYANRFGYAVLEKIDRLEAVARYITKYVTKDMMNTIKELNAHIYYASKYLNHSTVVAKGCMVRPLENPDFRNEHCAVKWFAGLDEGLAAFMEVTAS